MSKTTEKRVGAAFVALFLLLVAAWSAAAGAAELKLRAEVDRDRIGLEDQIMLEVVVEGKMRGGKPEAPPLDDFDVYPSGTSQSMQIVNGSMSMSVTYTYILVPKREGTFTIGPWVLRSDDKEYRSEPITVTVGRQAASKSAPNTPQGGTPDAGGEPREERDLFVVGRVDKQNAFVNEQIIYTFYLYRAERAAQITNVNYSPPEFQGFWVEKLKDSEKQYYKMLNGRRYIVTELSTAVFPTTSGKLSIAPATLQLVVMTTPFGFSLFDRGVERVLRTRDVTVEVSPLPAAGKPIIFEGAVGEALQLSATLDRTEVEEGEPVTLRTRVEGIGNVKTFSKPRLPELPQFKTYDSDSKTDIQATDRVSGSRSFEIVLVPKDEGEYDLAPLRLAYFDTREGRYRTLETKPLHVTAVKSSHPGRVAESAPAPQQQEIQILGRDIAHIRTDVPVSDTLTPLYRRGLFLAVLPVPLLFAVGATLLQRRRERLASDVALARSTRARKLAKKHLAAADRSLRAQQGEAFYADVSRALRQYVGDKLNVSATGMTHEALRERVLEAGVPEETASRLVQALERCDAARFAPGSMGGEQLRGMLREAEALLVALDGSWGRGAPRGRIRPGAGPMLGAWLAPLAAGMLSLAAATAVQAQSPASDPATGLAEAPPVGAEYVLPAVLLQRGHSAYEAGRFDEAITAYRQAERTGVRNGALYFDLGNAYFKDGQLGQAIACYRRAEMLSPRDDLVRANLEYALTQREDKAVQTRGVPLVSWIRSAFRWLSLNEWVAVAAALYAATCLLWIVGRLQRTRARAYRAVLWASVGLCALALLTVAAKVQATRGVERGVVTASKVDVTSGPGKTYTTEFSLHEGAEVRIERAREGWLRVSVSEKLRGWVPASSLVRI